MCTSFNLECIIHTCIHVNKHVNKHAHTCEQKKIKNPNACYKFNSSYCNKNSTIIKYKISFTTEKLC